MKGLARWLDHFIPPKLLVDPQSAWRSRFLIHAMVLGIVIASLSGVVYLVGGWWPGSVAVLGLALTLPLVAVVLRLTGSPAAGAHLGLGLMLVTFTLPTLVERDLDGALLALFALFPYLAVLLLDGRAAWLWLGLVLVALSAITASHQLALVPTVAVQSPLFVMLMRVAMLVSSVFFFGQRFAGERQRAMLDLERHSRARSAFMATISHEIRTPMNGVLGLTEVMLMGEGLDGTTRERLELVQRSGQSLVSLINDLLDFSKIEAGKLTVERTDFEFHTLLADLERLFAPLAAQKGLTFQVRAGDVPPVLQGDALRLRQVLVNLVNNGLKFTEQGTVTLEAKRLPGPAPALRLEVRDTGIGIAAEVVPRLFTPFEQADASTTRRFGGTGLGLALSQQLVELMGGRIQVETVPGRGSAFFFTLPLAEGQAQRAASVVSAPAAPRGALAPVLVVDDNIINLKVASALVERAGFQVVTATNGQEALELVQQRPFTAVLMDCHMPVMDGFEATRRIRELTGAGVHLPIIAVTASALPEEQAACLSSGMNGCLTKPVSFETIRAALSQVEPKGP